MLTAQLKEEINKRLLNKFDLKKIILFGSQAKGTSDDKSDVDLLLIANKLQDRLQYMRLVRQELLSMDYAFDIIAVTNEEFEKDKLIPGTVSRYAAKEGIVLYDS